MQFYSPSWLGQVDSEKTFANFPVFKLLYCSIVVTFKKQANNQWVKTLSAHSKLHCWWVNLYSEKNKKTMLGYFKGAFRLDAKQREATQSNQNLTSLTARERLRPLATFTSSCATALAYRQ